MTPASTPPRTVAGRSSSSIASSSANSPANRNNNNNNNNNTPPPRLPPKSLPPWVITYDESYGAVPEDQLNLLNAPVPSVKPHHNAAPEPPQRRISRDGFVGSEDPRLGLPREPEGRLQHFLRHGRAPRFGRKWDHLRSDEPVIVSAHRPAATEQSPGGWRDFVAASSWGRRTDEKSEVVHSQGLDQLQPNFNNDVEIAIHSTDPKPRGWRRIMERVWDRVMRSSLSPLLFRLVVMVTSIVALGISIRMYQLENAVSQDSADRSQSLVAVVVDCVAIPFIAYMVWDEYTGKPLGLRSAVSKMSLILLDLFFIIFKSASTALAFESVLYHSLDGHAIRELSKALATFMLLGLLAWVMNLTVNIFRVVERLGGREDKSSRV